LLGSLIHGLSPLDPLTLAGVAALLVGATWLSCVAPARTVRRVAPMRVLAEDG
jgi:hypothetical protein